MNGVANMKIVLPGGNEKENLAYGTTYTKDEPFVVSSGSKNSAAYVDSIAKTLMTFAFDVETDTKATVVMLISGTTMTSVTVDGKGHASGTYTFIGSIQKRTIAFRVSSGTAKIYNIAVYLGEGESQISSLTVPVIADALLTQELMTSDKIELSWQQDELTFLPSGSYVSWQGERYTLLEPYQPEHVDEVFYKYTPTFVAEQFTWAKYPFFLYTQQTKSDGTTYTLREPSWTLTDTPENFMEQIVSAILSETGETWTYETVADGYDVGSTTLTFDNVDILSALNSVADAFGSEWFVDKAKKIIYLKTALVAYSTTQTYYPLVVGTNVGMPTISNNKDEEYFNRFYVFGSTRNITQDMELASSNIIINRRLTLNEDEYPEGYIDAEEDPAHVYSKVLVYDDIYPHADLKVSDVICHTKYKEDEAGNYISTGDGYDTYGVYYIKLVDGSTGADFVFNNSTYNKDTNPEGNYISGLNLSINFKTGSLRGREFELEYVDEPKNLKNVDTGERITVPVGYFAVLFIEESGYVIPSASLAPKAGDDPDEVILFNCRMPDSYVTTAQDELKEQALLDIASYDQDTASYTVESYATAFKQYDPDLTIGSGVSLNKTLRGTLQTRVTKIERHLDLPYIQTITVGNERIKGTIGSLKEQMEVQSNALNEVTIVAKSAQRAQQSLPRQFSDTRETMEALVDSKLAGYSEQISPIAVQTMQTIVGDESLQFRFVTSLENIALHISDPDTYPLTETYLDAVWDEDTQSYSIMASYLQHMTYGVASISCGAEVAKARRQWELSAFESGALTDTEQTYYLYAVVDLYDQSEANYGTGHFELSESGHAMDEDEGYLWLLVGILGSESDGVRSFAQMYGYTEILPGRITTEKISSADGETYFDLKNGEIGGNIKFNSGNVKEIESIVDTATSGMTSDIASALGAAQSAESAAASAVSTATAAQSAIDGLEVGGRNMLRGTQDTTLGTGTLATASFKDLYSYGTLTQVTLSDEGLTSPVQHVTKGVKMELAKVSSQRYVRTAIYQSGIDIVEGETYTLSAWVYCNEGSNIGVQGWYFSGTDYAGQQYTADTAGWHHLSVTGTAKRTATCTQGPMIYLQIVTTTGLDSDTVYICAPKMERGSIMTDWTPAPEDVDANIADVAEQASQAVDELHSTVGGPNLARGTAEPALYFKSEGKTWVNSAWRRGGTTSATWGTVELVDVTDSPVSTLSKAVAVTPDGAWASGNLICQDDFPLSAGAYTLSCYVKGYANLKVRISVMGTGNYVTKTLTDDTWTRLTTTLTLSEATTGIGCIINPQCAKGKTAYILGIKLEKGTMATDWCPAAQDSDANLAALDYLKESLLQATEDETLVSGGLVLSTFIGVRESGSDMLKAGMNGNAGNELPMIFAGRTEDLSNGTCQIWGDDGLIVSTDGTNDCTIQNSSIKFKQSGVEKNVITSESSSGTIASMLASVTNKSEYTVRDANYFSASAEATKVATFAESTAIKKVKYYQLTTSLPAAGKMVINSFTVSQVLTLVAYYDESTLHTMNLTGRFGILLVSDYDATSGDWDEEYELYSTTYSKSNYKTSQNDDTISGSSGQTISSFSVTVSAGQTWGLYIYMSNLTYDTYSEDSSVKMTSAYFNASLSYTSIKASVTYSMYRNTTYADGMFLSSASNKYIGFLPRATDGYTAYARNGQYGVALTTSGLKQVKWTSASATTTPTLRPVSPLALVARLTYGSSGWNRSVVYNPQSISDFAIEKVSDGVVKFTHLSFGSASSNFRLESDHRHF